MTKSNWRDELYLDEVVGGAGTLVRQGIKIGCIEEIALRNGWITGQEVEACIPIYGKTDYAEYLHKLL